LDDKLVEEALAAYDRIIGLDLSEVAVDGSVHVQTPWERLLEARAGWHDLTVPCHPSSPPRQPHAPPRSAARP